MAETQPGVEHVPGPSPTVLHVIFTPHTVQRLVPFAWSLLRLPEVVVRLVANGCDDDEQRLLARVAALDPRLSVYRLPTDMLWRHAEALEHLLDAFDDDIFAFIDSDIIALHAGEPLTLPSQLDAAWGDAPPIWWAHTALPKLGTTYVAMYRRSAVRAIRSATGVGFGRARWHEINPMLQIELEANGMRQTYYDTAKLLNAFLMIRGFATGVLDCTHLLHLGQYSSVLRTATVAKGMVRVNVQDPRWWLGQLWFGVRHRQLRAVVQRTVHRTGKQWMTVYFDTLLNAIAAEQPTPALPWYIRGLRRQRLIAATRAFVTLDRDFKAAFQRVQS